MTYPQQQPWQQQGGYPGGQYGQYGAAPGGYPGNHPGAHPGHGYGGYGPPPPPPPPRNNTGAVVAVVLAAVVVLTTLGVTGFVAPGFFLSDDKESATDGGTENGTESGTETSAPDESDVGATDPTVEAPEEATESAGDGTDGAALIEDLVDAINAGDAQAANDLLCSSSSAETDVANAITGSAAIEVDDATLTTDPYYAGADLTGTLDGEPVRGGRTSAFNEPDGWCILTFYVF